MNNKDLREFFGGLSDDTLYKIRFALTAERFVAIEQRAPREVINLQGRFLNELGAVQVARLARKWGEMVGGAR